MKEQVNEMSEKKILTLHPEGKRGVNISQKKYDIIRQFILQTLRKKREISFKELTDLALKQLQESFDGKVVWYLVTIKLDLEARNIIERIPKATPQRIRMC